MRDAGAGAPKEELDTCRLSAQILGDRLHVNRTPAGDIRASAAGVAKFVEAEGCRDVYFQPESGQGATLPPRRGQVSPP